MSITSRCTECQSTMLDGILTHSKDCSANNFIPKVDYGITPPPIELHFDSLEEQEAWIDKLKTGSGGPSTQPQTQQSGGDELRWITDLRCPACNSSSTLFVGNGGYITCSLNTCPDPDYADALKVATQSKERAARIDERQKLADRGKDLATMHCEFKGCRFSCNASHVMKGHQETNHRQTEDEQGDSLELTPNPQAGDGGESV
jgi:hypothetical protein